MAELLIVVAIIAVLVAIAIPIFNAQLTKARLATDKANVRSAKAAAAAEYMSDEESGSVTYVYDGSKAIRISNANSASAYSSIDGYGKSDGKDNANGQTGATGTPKGGYVEVTISDTGTQIQAKWITNVKLSGDISSESIQRQLAKAGLKKEDVAVFTAEKGTKLNENTTGNKKLSQLFSGYTHLQTIDLSNATLEKGNMELFAGVPDSVNEIKLPSCTSNYDIRGIWYYADGTSFYPSGTGSGANNVADTRITPTDVETHGGTIYREPPNQKKDRRSKDYNGNTQ